MWYCRLCGQRRSVPLFDRWAETLEYRGYDSAGIAVYDKGTISIEKKKGRLANLEAA